MFAEPFLHKTNVFLILLVCVARPQGVNFMTCFSSLKREVGPSAGTLLEISSDLGFHHCSSGPVY